MEPSLLQVTKDIVINELEMKWVRRFNEVLHICMKKEDCKINTIKCNKKEDPDIYKYLCLRFGFE